MRRRWYRFSLIFGLASLGWLTFVGVAAAQAPNAGTPDLTDDLGSWAALVGIALPAITALVQKASWPSYVNAIVFGAAVVIASVVYGWIRFKGDFDWQHWEAALLAIVLWGLGTYHTFYKPGGDTSVATKLRSMGPIR